MVPTSLPGGRPRGMVRVSPRMPREAMWSGFGVRAYSSGVFPPSSAIGSSAIPSPWRTTYFIAITALGVCLSNRGERGERAGEREREAQRRPTRRARRHAAGGRSEHPARSPRIVRCSRRGYSDRLLAMLRVRYTTWDGTQEIRLEAERVFEKLAEYLSFTDDVQQALDWLLHQGLEWRQGMRVMGLDDFLEQLREEMRARYREVNLRHALGEIRDKLEGLLDLERDALDALEDRARAARKRDLLDRLPHRLSEALGRLRDYDFEDTEAANTFEALLEELDDIRDLEDFTRRYGDLFHGPRSLSYEEALALMRAMERLKRLEEQLVSGDLDAVDPESLRELLGLEAGQNFQLLKDVMLLPAK